MTKHYVEIYYQGSFFPETTVKEVETRNPIDLPKGAYGFMFFDIEEVEVNGEVLTGSRKNESNMYYSGEVLSLEDVKQIYPNKKTLISNMENNGIDKVVKTTVGNFQPFKDNDIILNK